MPAQSFILKIKKNKSILYKLLLASAVTVIIVVSFTAGYLAGTNHSPIRLHAVSEFQDDQPADEASSPGMVRENPDQQHSKMEPSAAGVSAALEIDPICGMKMTAKDAHAAGRESQYRGKTYYFCSDQCKELFDRSPESYLSQGGKSAGKNVEERAVAMTETRKDKPRH